MPEHFGLELYLPVFLISKAKHRNIWYICIWRNLIPFFGTDYYDLEVATGHHTYCVKAVYTDGESEAVCTEARVNASVLSPASNLIASIVDRNVYLEWTAPATGNVLGYNVYRDDSLLTMIPVFSAYYNDLQVDTGHHVYCVKAVYAAGESDAVCTEAWITYGIPEMEAAVKVYPNPAGEVINIETPANFSKVRILSVIGQEVYTYAAEANKLKILTAGFKPGIYLIQMAVGEKTFAQRISIK